jgi:tetratricopeptide (TPR) repeat protein
MSISVSHPSQSRATENSLAELVEELSAKIEAHEPIDLPTYLAAHPAHAEELNQLVPALLLLADFSRSGAASVPPVIANGPDNEIIGRLGDFRIIREVGRGGMGIVYQAEQISLGRRVALKVLPFASTLDPKQLQRFKNEAQAAACLHHTNIVPVHATGCERGVHFYAMQYIEGHTLADLIAGLRGNAHVGQVSNLPPRQTNDQSQVTEPYVPQDGLGTEVRHSTLGILSSLGIRNSSFFRTVAQLGVQAAEALEHAHQLGIVHRDIKPGNLLVDARGQLWITDFGLAQVQGGTNLTMSGDLLGTLRYMSPEQALAKRVVIDHRTDVYSLGATLYELLTLEPAFPGRDRQELLRQIAFEEPKPPRRLSRAIPGELETIVLKAMEKNPADRYAAAQDLADDLERFLKDEPIRARRPTLLQRARKWGRRHKAAVWAAAVCMSVTLLVVAVSIGWGVRDREALRATTAEQVNRALNEADLLKKQQRWGDALARLKLAEPLLADSGEAALRDRAQELRRDLEMAARLDDLRLHKEHGGDSGFGGGDPGTARAYAKAFEAYGIDILKEPPEQVAESIQARSIAEQLVAALDDWILVRLDRGERERLRSITALVDDNELRNQMRDAIVEQNWDALKKLAGRPEVADFSPATGYLLGQALANAGAGPQAVQVLAAVQRRHPQDFWLNYQLGIQFLWGPQVQHNHHIAAGYLRAALVARPDYATVYLYLGIALPGPEHLDEVIALNRKAVELVPTYYDAYSNLGCALLNRGQVDEAIAACEEAIRLKPDSAHDHSNLGAALEMKGLLDEAIAACEEAICLKPDFAEAHINLGIALGKKGQLDEAIAEYREAIQLKTDYAAAHNNLAGALHQKGRLDEAIEEYRQAIALRKELPEPHSGLGRALHDKGQLDEAIAEYHWAIRLNKDDLKAHGNLGSAFRAKGLLDDAIREQREALRIDKDNAIAHFNLGNTLDDKGQLDEAIREWREALRLNTGSDFAETHHALGRGLGKKGLLDDAIVEFRKALQIKEDARTHYELGVTFGQKGRTEEAIAEYRAAIRLKNDYPEAHWNLGVRLARQGKFREAVEELRLGHQLGSRDPRWSGSSAQSLREVEQLVVLDAKLAKILEGAAQPADAAERIGLAKLCQWYKKLNAAAARFYAEAFAQDPKLIDDLGTSHRYNAACAAALAGCGEGDDAAKLDSDERARLRRQAMDWLRADLAAWRRVLEADADKARATVQQTLRHWQQDTDFAGVSGHGLAKLPETEWQAWQQLWADVEQTLRKANTNGTKGANKKSWD